ncbi:MAG TPA: hypothetical protein VFB20_04410 [Burkholderiales bacterium]|nr:hypothetical protein [Burkholderiales bacterium]
MLKHQETNVLSWIGAVLSHGIITLLAIGIAFTLPVAAQYILYQWWPRVETDSHLLLTTETVVASMLVVLFNLAKVSWDNRRFVGSARVASLVHARSNESWLSRWRSASLFRRLPAARDAYVMTVTGYDTFIDRRSLFRAPLATACEIRVMLLNPASDGARRRIDSLPGKNATAQTFAREIEASIGYLGALRKAGKKVTLRFYNHPPFWKLVVLGDHVWVQYCHAGCEIRRSPEYVFAMHRRHPRRGLFVPFFMYFLEKWSEAHHPEFDFDTRQLVYRDREGRELKRLPFVNPLERANAAEDVRRAA